MKFYKCKHCENIAVKLTEGVAPLFCCGEEMYPLKAGITDAAREKHLPVFTLENGMLTVKSGELPHPMLKEHSIEWIAVQTNKGFQVKWLGYEIEPESSFALCKEERLESVWAYCNVHGLWETRA